MTPLDHLAKEAARGALSRRRILLNALTGAARPTADRDAAPLQALAPPADSRFSRRTAVKAGAAAALAVGPLAHLRIEPAAAQSSNGHCLAECLKAAEDSYKESAELWAKLLRRLLEIQKDDPKANEKSWENYQRRLLTDFRQMKKQQAACAKPNCGNKKKYPPPPKIPPNPYPAPPPACDGNVCSGANTCRSCPAGTPSVCVSRDMLCCYNRYWGTTPCN